MNRIKINYNNITPNPILGKDLQEPGIYKNRDTNYKGCVYINQSRERFYLDPNTGVIAYDHKVWDDDSFIKVDAKSVTIEL